MFMLVLLRSSDGYIGITLDCLRIGAGIIRFLHLSTVTFHSDTHVWNG